MLGSAPLYCVCASGLAILLALVAPVSAQSGRPPTNRQPPAQAPRQTPGARAPRPAPRYENPDERYEPAAERERPGAAPLVVEELDPRTEQLLQDWELNSSKVKKLRGQFFKYTYDHTFYVEKRASGEFYYEAPDKGTYEVQPANVRGIVSKKIDPAGKPFTVQADTGERWLCTGTEIYQINDKEKTYDVLAIPPEHQGENIMDGPLPFLFGMKAEQAKRRYRLKVIAETKTSITIHVKPRWQQDASNYREARIILSKASYLPTAVQLINPDGSESVHTFPEKELDDNPRSLWPGSNPLDPKVARYKKVIAPERASQYAEEMPPPPNPLQRPRKTSALPLNDDPPRQPVGRATLPRRTAELPR